MAKAVYAGSFDPFTIGHLSVVKQAAQMFDEVYILIAKNPLKKRTTLDIETTQILITDVLPYSIPTADFAEMLGATFLVRGIRDAQDYFYETRMAQTNKLLNPNLHTIYMEAEVNISSSTVRTLMEFNKPFLEYLPHALAEYISEGHRRLV